MTTTQTLTTLAGRIIVPNEEQMEQYAVHGRTAFNLEEALKENKEVYVNTSKLSRVSPIVAYWNQSDRVQLGDDKWGFSIRDSGIILASEKCPSNDIAKAAVKNIVHVDFSRELRGLYCYSNHMIIRIEEDYQKVSI